MTPEQFALFFVEFFKDFYLDFALMSLVFGFCGAALYEGLFSTLDSLFEKSRWKRRLATWKARQSVAKVDQETQPRGDGVAGRACETRSDSAA